MTTNPLISFVLLTYNQEEFIVDAVKGAFAQTYPNLEILISDDCSRDRTFDLVQAMAKTYTGPHKIVCSRNVRNLGIAGHVNKINAMAKGELIVIAAGDDISMPERARKIADVYSASVASGCPTHYFYSPALAISADGTEQGIVTSPGGKNIASPIRAGLSSYPLAVGATQAWSRGLVDSFRGLGTRVWAEDQILGFRGLLMGPVQFIDEPLVRYRVGSGISTRKQAFSLRKYFAGKIDQLWIFHQRCSDAAHAGRYALSAIIAGKAVLLTVAMPFSPIISLMRKASRL